MSATPKGDFSWLSASHMYLLSLFLKPRPIASITNPGWNEVWTGVLCESPEMALARLKSADMLEAAPDVNGLASLVCSGSSQIMAEQFRDQQKAQEESHEERVLNFLSERRFRDACLMVGQFEASRPFPRGLGIDWKKYNPDRDIALCQYIFENTRSEETDRVAACAMNLIGSGDPKRFLPNGKNRRVPMDEKIVVHKISRAAHARLKLEEIKQNRNIFRAISIVPSGACCSTCEKDHKEWAIDSAPSLPHEGCEDTRGCRCMYIGVAKKHF